MIAKEKIFNGIIILLPTLLICFLIINILFSSKSSSPILQQHLVTQNEIQKTKCIKLTQSNRQFSIIIKKTLSEWDLVIDNTYYYRVKDRMINNVLNELLQKRTFYSIGTNNGIPYGVGKPETINLSLLDSNNNIIQTINYGNTDLTGEDIYLMILNEKSILRTKNTFSDFLTLKASSWVDLSIFSTQIQETKIEEIRYTKENITKIFRAPNDFQILAFSSVLESLTCIDITNISRTPSETIAIIFGDTTSLQISFAAFNDVWILKNETQGNSYIITSKIKESIERSLD